MANTFYIKNMVCPRCVEAVTTILNELEMNPKYVELGKAVTFDDISEKQKKVFQQKLQEKGFELLEDKNSKLISQIKSIVIEQVHHAENNLSINFSTLLTNKLSYDYTYLSKLFSSVEGYTIEKFIIKQKIERVKELLFYKQLTLSEISFLVGYSSVSHLSAQFKKETGMSPSQFKKLRNPNLKSLDSL